MDYIENSKQHVRLTSEQKDFLNNEFKYGMERKNRKAAPSDVAKKMRSVFANRQLWLNEEQIRHHFSRLASKGKQGSVKPSVAEMEDAAEEYRCTLQQEVVTQIREDVQQEKFVEEGHPLWVQGINICSVANTIYNVKFLKNSELYSIEMKKLKKILNEIGIKDFKGQSRQKIGAHILTFVKENCDCLILKQLRGHQSRKILPDIVFD